MPGAEGLLAPKSAQPLETDGLAVDAYLPGGVDGHLSQYRFPVMAFIVLEQEHEPAGSDPQDQQRGDGRE